MTTTTTQPTPAPKPDAQPVQAAPAPFVPRPWAIATAGEHLADWAVSQPKIGRANDGRIRECVETGIWMQDHKDLIASAPALMAALERIAAGDTMTGRETWSLADVIQEHYRIAREALQMARGGAK